LFRDAAHALLDLYLDLDEGEPTLEREREPIDLQAEDGEALLIDFLNELIFRFDTRGLLCAAIEIDSIRLDAPARLAGTLVGDRFDPSRHVSRTEVKAATFHDMTIERSPEGLRATVVFDL